MFGNFEEQQKEMEKKLKAITVHKASSENEINITMNASLEVENISIDLSKLDLTSSDQLEDLILVTMNEAIQQAQLAQAAESQKMLANMMPGGLGDLGKLFGQ
ncbi:MAG: YbaB/EbfC family nucleoid-associated protein [Saprospiraceae bacterium]|nr:YbaB/EbfC family nucleoid-associated protein [Saprospiraceae bacterium]QLH29384.1 MAG: YbaB/EbfC family nucleoid-associated protein [Candidatus Parvibacillus calidus]MBX7178335.1 YbaB/EbfC family nucleoid-associated protein [Saprospiraceae bacterium]MCB0591590.1 YbaB/EbfC family nucleoid-associated protein [Saprospiraceae bacterium]MCO5283277.1 YbaB/EbfC family nucleoid-associated protein [Saprospiraceae bacterium]